MVGVWTLQRYLGAFGSLAAFFLAACCAHAADDSQFNGRWDISVNGDTTRTRAWWLEVTGAGTDAMKGRFVGAPGGQVDDIPKLTISDGELRFAFERKYRRDDNPKSTQKGLYWARLESGKLKGTFEIEGDPSTYLEWTGVHAPVLPDKDDGTWKRGDPIQLFNGKDLSGWQPLAAGKPPGWTVKDGLLTNSPNAVDLASEKKFWNFDLHIEFLVAVRSNSGVGLRGRYEVQIYDDYDEPPTRHGNGALYSRIVPRSNASREPGEWQFFDIRLIGRQVSISLNGVKVIDKATIDGLTAIAQDANESDPGPIILQGDHGFVQFRKVTVYPLSNADRALPARNDCAGTWSRGRVQGVGFRLLRAALGKRIGRTRLRSESGRRHGGIVCRREPRSNCPSWRVCCGRVPVSPRCGA